MYRLIVTVRICGEMEWVFTSEPMSELWADILLREFISRTPFEVLRARKVPDGGLNEGVPSTTLGVSAEQRTNRS